MRPAWPGAGLIVRRKKDCRYRSIPLRENPELDLSGRSVGRQQPIAILKSRVIRLPIVSVDVAPVGMGMSTYGYENVFWGYIGDGRAGDHDSTKLEQGGHFMSPRHQHLRRDCAICQIKQSRVRAVGNLRTLRDVEQ